MVLALVNYNREFLHFSFQMVDWEYTLWKTHLGTVILLSYAQTQYLQNTMLQGASISEPGQSFHHALQAYIQVCGLLPYDFDINTIAPHFMKSLAARYFAVIKKDFPINFSLSARDHSGNVIKLITLDFLKAIPIQGLNQSIGPRQFRAVLIYRLGIPIFGPDSFCPFCKRDIDIYGDHAVHCASEIGGKYRHDMVCDTFADICYKSGVAARKEVHMGFLSDSVKALRPA